MNEQKKRPSFAGLRVLTLESRRAVEMAKLIANYGGEPIIAPSMREVPLESNKEALAFASTLFAGGFDFVIFLTGVGTRALTRVIETTYSREQFVEGLKKVKVIARGPKPLAALKELGVTVALSVPEPNTWRDSCCVRSMRVRIPCRLPEAGAWQWSGIRRLQSGVIAGT